MDNKIKSNRGKISIIIPCYNDATFIEKSVNSALDQDYLNKEVIVVDDGSNHKTKLKLKKLKSKFTKLIIQENKGAGAARNAGISQATGELILTLDSDDYFENSFCSKAVRILKEKPEARIVSCYANRFRGNKQDLIKHENATVKDFLKFNHALGNALFYRSDWEMVGGYDEKMTQGYEDWEFFIRILKNGGYSHIIKEPLFNYRLRKVSNSTKAEKKKYELLKYIYLKHEELYVENYEVLVNHLLNRLEVTEKAERKNLQTLEFRIGAQILMPIKTIKKFLKF